MQDNPIYEKQHELDYLTLGRFIGTSTMLITYKRLHNGIIPPDRLELLVQQFLEIATEYQLASDKLYREQREQRLQQRAE